MNFWRRLAVITGLTLGTLVGAVTYAKDQPSYITGSSNATQRQLIKYEIAFVARFDNRIVVDSGEVGPSVDDVIAGSGTLLDKGGVTIGRFDANTRVSERMNDGDRRLLFVTYSFGDGQNSLVILGVGTYRGKHGLLHQEVKNNFSIVGGTGKFMASGGQCQIARIDQIDYQVTCTAFVPDY
jgi:hypothetical protein